VTNDGTVSETVPAVMVRLQVPTPTAFTVNVPTPAVATTNVLPSVATELAHDSEPTNEPTKPALVAVKV